MSRLVFSGLRNGRRKFNQPRRDKESGGIISSLIFLLFLIVVCAILYFARHPLMRFAAEAWLIEDPLQRADALMVLSDDNFYGDRATRATELYRQGLAPLVVASGRKLRPYAGIAELMKHDLIERGVPEDKIIPLSHDVANTREEAQDLRRLAAQHHWRSVIVVTSNYHTRRARYIFRRIFPRDITVAIASARDNDFDPERWWEKRVSVKFFAREAAGMIVTMWELRHTNSEISTGETLFLEDGGGPKSQYIVCSNRAHSIWATRHSTLQPLSPVISSPF
jgi:uncharacterized SAM-binding protein YcdF (DUF218 family)